MLIKERIARLSLAIFPGKFTLLPFGLHVTGFLNFIPLALVGRSDLLETIKTQVAASPESGYGEWLAAEIEAGIAELDAEQASAAAGIWRSFSLECS